MRLSGIFLLLFMHSPILSAQSGSIQGLIADPDGAPLAGIEVSLYVLQGETWVLQAWQNSAVDGVYAFSDLTAGSYTLLMRDWSQVWAFEYYDDANRLQDAAVIDVLDASITIDFELALGGRIAGRLTDPGGAPLDAPLVFVHTAEETPELLFLTNPDPATGDYEIGGLPTGNYLMQFTGRQGLESYSAYYDDAATIDDAAPISVVVGETTPGVDGELGIPPGGVIEGSIVDPYGRAFDFAAAEAYAWDGDAWTLAGRAETEFYESEYRLATPPGTYRLRYEGGSFLQPDSPAAEFYDDVAEIDDGADVSVDLDGIVEIDVVVGDRATGSLSGIVTDAVGDAPLEGIEVYPMDRSGRVLWDQVALTDDEGRYLIEGLWPEGYLLDFYDPAFLYENRRIGHVLVGEDPVSGVDVALDLSPTTLPGSITGVVTDAADAPIAGVRVYAASFSGGAASALAETDSQGRYRLRGVSAGAYTVRFSASSGFWMPEYYDDAPDSSSAVAVTVLDASETTDVDAMLAPAGVVEGTVTDAFGNDFFITSVVAFAWDGAAWNPVADTTLAYETDYRLKEVPVGTVRLLFTGIRNAGPNLSEYYDDVATIDLATDVPIVQGETTSGVDAVLGELPGGAISGTVDDGTGAPLAGIRVRVYDADLFLEAEATTGSGGAYEFAGLFSGVYYVEFIDSSGTYPGEAWNDVASLDLATPIVVAGSPILDVDASLDGFGDGPGGGGMRGVVISESTGLPIEGIRVRCSAVDFSSIPNCSAVTAADGSYQLGGSLPAGDYVVSFRSQDGFWAEEYYDDQSDFAAATPVTTTLGAWTDDVDAALQPAGAISGTVTNEGGNSFPLLTVTAFAWNGAAWQEFRSFLTAYDTEYFLGGLPAGTYRVRFRGGPISNPSTGIVEYYDDADSLAEAVDVVVDDGEVTAGIDAVLESGGDGAISGTVTDGAGVGLEGVTVRIWDRDLSLEEEVATGPNGVYQATRLFGGTHYVDFVDPNGVFPAEAWNDVPSLQLATPISVPSNGTVSGVDAALDGSGSGPGGGGFRGTVTNEQTGAPIEGVRVRCVATDFSWSPPCSTTTASDGSYELGGNLPAGSYLISFRSGDGLWAQEWYDDAASFDAATPIAATLGAWTAGVDAALQPAGAISGSVVNPGGGAYSLLVVTAYAFESGAWSPFRTVLTAYETEYVIDGLPAGDYRLRFRGGSISNPSSGVVEYYDDVASLAEGTDVPVIAGQVTTGIDAVLGDTLGAAVGLLDPEFDDGVAAWTTDAASGAVVEHSPRDHHGMDDSGSLSIRTTSAAAGERSTISQCVEASGAQRYRFGARLSIAGAMQTAPIGYVSVEFFTDEDCAGSAASMHGTSALQGDADWTLLRAEATSPEETSSARISLRLESGAAADYEAWWDGVEFGELFFLWADDFESGTTDGWTRMVNP